MRISRRLPISVEHAFAIVNDVEKYPQFLPQVRKARVVSQKGDERLVEIEFHHPLLSAVQRSVARSDPPYSIDIEQIEGVSKTFRLHWRFRPTEEGGTEISAEVEIEFDSRLLSGVLGRAMERMIAEMVDHFEKRAQDHLAGDAR